MKYVLGVLLLVGCLSDQAVAEKTQKTIITIRTPGGEVHHCTSVHRWERMAIAENCGSTNYTVTCSHGMCWTEQKEK